MHLSNRSFPSLPLKICGSHLWFEGPIIKEEEEEQQQQQIGASFSYYFPAKLA
jgi:hypothetical protein